ncbi:LOW QUALITY PROTEIN: hypothetical protein BRADI_4g42671v3 [Brachypodium distachyon]|uniref:RING-type domain-containing protein n=2 Tax=Brachypodium distachyon TaxID=15368 RepID=A0A2K2CTU8_BRADI|nr:LOW QUALITY PROTEIN: hypothetical protein BRADI_4g42671v3 [Brachypodium distachyon]
MTARGVSLDWVIIPIVGAVVISRRALPWTYGVTASALQRIEDEDNDEIVTMEEEGRYLREVLGMEDEDDDYGDADVMMDVAYANGGFGAVPASGESVSTLETRKHDGSGGDGGCVICLEEYEVGEELSVVPCEHRHEFHRSCLEQWLALSRLCPLCRHALPAGRA